METKAIILDMDGTLLNSEKKIDEKTKECLISAQKEKGVKVILASGRTTIAMMEYAEILKMPEHHGLLISYNGSKVVDCETGEEFFNQPIAMEEGKAVLEHLKDFDVKVIIDKDDYMYVNNVYDCFIKYNGEDMNIIEYESRGGNYKLCEVDDLAQFLDYDINKILTAADSEYLIKNHKEMSEPFKDSLSCMFTADFYYEFTAKDVDKAKALDSALKVVNIKPEETVAFGDGHNDISMVNYAGIGVAMENAVPELKEVADRITLSNNEGGIAHILNEFL